MPGRMCPRMPVQQHHRGPGSAAAAMHNDPVEVNVPLAEPGEHDSEPLTMPAHDNTHQPIQRGVVASAEETKFALLGVDRGPVITAQPARQMATGVTRPCLPRWRSPDRGRRPGRQGGAASSTVFIAVSTPSGAPPASITSTVIRPRWWAPPLSAHSVIWLPRWPMPGTGRRHRPEGELFRRPLPCEC